MTTATELWQARQISNIRKDQIMRNELDLARVEVEKMAAEITQLASERDAAFRQATTNGHQIVTLTAEVERLSSELAMSVGIVTQLDIENQRLNRDNDELRAMCEIVERMIGERDRARDLAVRAGAFDNDRASLTIAQLQEDVDTLSSELGYMERERDQALYERDSLLYRTARGAILSPEVREAVEFSRGLIPTRPRDGR